MSFCAVQSLDCQGLGRVSQWIFVVFQRELGEADLLPPKSVRLVFLVAMGDACWLMRESGLLKDKVLG